MSDFTIENVKEVLMKVVDVDEFPQEVLTVDLKRTIGKVVGKIHPQILAAFLAGMEDMGIIETRGNITIINMGYDEL